MSCLHPIHIKYDDVVTKCVRAVDVPCGRCIDCLRKKQNDWYLRFQQELKVHDTAVFFTLTYNEDNVPYSDCGYRTCCKTHVQNWIKLGRELYFKKYGKRLDVKYFVCSEYGPRTFRPHYHGIFFGMEKDVFTLFFANVWRRKYGYVSLSNLWQKSQGACRYLSKYCNKGIFECPLVKEEYVEKPFRLVSKGMGLNYVEKYKRYHLGRDVKCGETERVSRAVLRSKLYCNGFGYSLPRYYRSKIFGCSQEDVSATAFRRKMSNYVQSEVFADDLRKYNSLVSRGFTPTDIDAYFKSEDVRKADQVRSVFERSSRFFNKSKL